MPRALRIHRSLAIVRIRRALERESLPRLQMSLIVALTGALGFVASFVLLRLGMDDMALRYPLALALAYLFFLGLLRVWLHLKTDDAGRLTDLVDLLPGPGSPGGPAPIRSGGGGDFGGAGADGAFDATAAPASELPRSISSVAEVGGAVGDADELAVPLIAIALAIGLALAALYVIHVAPLLFAELLVDSGLAYALYRRLRRDDGRHWLATALRRTALPFALTAIFLAVVGAALASHAPGARSVGEALRQATVDRPA